MTTLEGVNAGAQVPKGEEAGSRGGKRGRAKCRISTFTWT